MNRVLWLISILVLAGCSCPVPETTLPAEERPQRLAEEPKLSGVWVSPKGDVANDWQVALLPDGKMTVSGPGLRGHGKYRVENDRAVASLSERNGAPPAEPDESQLTFKVDPATKELTFQTGIPGDDYPVSLVPQNE